MVETRNWTSYDQEHGQYSMAVLSAETTVLRYKVYVLTLETDAAKIDALEAEFLKRGESINTNMQRIMDNAVDFVTVTGLINDDISSWSYSEISSDKTLLTSQHNNFKTIYDLSMENSVMSANLAKNKVLITIGSQTGPEMDQILNLTTKAEDLLTIHKLRCNDAKFYMDEAFIVGDEALAQLIANIPPSAN
ncbi:hypothetical protein B566_EDAN016966 [Ephemera danica]|nr:hypothetical protein B566_EDAN016966 [Ephemera danica]